MAKNLMPEFARMLGLELGEAFYIKDFGTLYRFTLKGLEYQNDDDKRWYRISSCLIEDLINGEREIEKQPFKPRPGDVYWYVYWLFDVTKKWELEVGSTKYCIQHAPDNLCVAVGNCFKTREEAEVHKYEAFKRLTGMDWPRSLQRVGGDNENM